MPAEVLALRGDSGPLAALEWSPPGDGELGRRGEVPLLLLPGANLTMREGDGDVPVPVAFEDFACAALAFALTVAFGATTLRARAGGGVEALRWCSAG